jgi:hypothetical protein
MCFDLIGQGLDEGKVTNKSVGIEDDVVLDWDGLFEMRLQENAGMRCSVLLKILSTSIANIRLLILENVSSLGVIVSCILCPFKMALSAVPVRLGKHDYLVPNLDKKIVQINTMLSQQDSDTCAVRTAFPTYFKPFSFQFSVLNSQFTNTRDGDKAYTAPGSI